MLFTHPLSIGTCECVCAWVVKYRIHQSPLLLNRMVVVMLLMYPFRLGGKEVKLCRVGTGGG